MGWIEFRKGKVNFMKTVKLGNSKTEVSQMALGCLPFGTKLTKDQSFEILDYYLEQGGSFLDTSNNYSFWDAGGKGGDSETVLGKWFEERKNRDKVFLATKVGANPIDVDEFLNYKGSGDPWTELTEGLSRKAIFEAVDKSLKRLKTDYVDLYYAHVDNRQTNLEETLEAFNDLVKNGKVLHIGCSNYKIWRIAKAKEISKHNNWVQYEAVQMFHTYFQSEKGANTSMFDQMSDEIMDYARTNRDITLLGYTPLLWGSYTRKEKYEEIPCLKAFVRPQNDERYNRLLKISNETGVSINQVIYAWMMQSDPVIIPLVAVSRMEHLREDLDSVNLVLTKEQMEYLQKPLN